MANRYVRLSGNDTTGDGNSPATAWRTIGRAFGNNGLASGDVLYIGPGTYREIFSANNTFVTFSALTRVVGDVLGEVTGDAPGPVIVTSFLTDWKTAAASASIIDLSNQSWVAFEHLIFVGYGSSCISIGGTSAHISVQDCAFICSGTGSSAFGGIHFACGVGVTADAIVERCLFYPSQGKGITIRPSTDASLVTELSLDITIRSCMFHGLLGSFSPSVFCEHGGTPGAGGKLGGVDIEACSIFSNIARGIHTTTSAWSTTNPVTVRNCFISSTASGALFAQTLGQIVEDYNVIHALTPRTNVAIGANSVSGITWAMIQHIGQEFVWDGIPQPFGMPWTPFPNDLSPILGLSGDPAFVLTDDLLGRPRPAGGQSLLKAVGALEAHDTARLGTALGGDDGAYIELVGPADQDFFVPVSAEAHTISVKTRWDTNHGTATPPQMLLLAAPELGVAAQTVTAIGDGTAYETLTTASFTPTADGVVKIRLLSRPTAANGIAAFDTVVVA